MAENDFRDNLHKEAEKARIQKEAFNQMLGVLENFAPENRRSIFSLPLKVSRVTDKISELMMLTSSMEDDIGYAAKACEFLDRVEEACAAFIEQAKTAGE